LVALTWKAGKGLVLDRTSFELRSTFDYQGEGWGITASDKWLYMSDGSADIRMLDPETLREEGRLTVTAEGRPVTRLNELEWVSGELSANIWQSDLIARIDPETGAVLGWIDLAGLLEAHGDPAPRADVLNGIAYDPATDQLFVTGKFWPHVFQIERRPKHP